MLTITSLVTRQRGSWKYQDAYGVSTYQPKQTKTGKWVWESVNSRGKWSMPQIKRYQINHDFVGGLHHKPMSPAEISAMAFASAGLI